MESLALPFLLIVPTMFALTLASVVFSILVAFRKTPRVVGYAAIAIQAVLSVIAFLMRAEFGYIYLAIFVVCALLVFVPSQNSRK